MTTTTTREYGTFDSDSFVAESLGDQIDDFNVDALQAAYRTHLNELLAPTGLTLYGRTLIGPATFTLDQEHARVELMLDHSGDPADADSASRVVRTVANDCDELFWSLAQSYEFGRPEWPGDGACGGQR